MRSIVEYEYTSVNYQLAMANSCTLSAVYKRLYEASPHCSNATLEPGAVAIANMGQL